MFYGKYSTRCLVESPMILPQYKGSTLRGAFGSALKRVVCALKRIECQHCILNPRCLYVQVFEATELTRSEPANKRSQTPHPFVIEPPLTTETEFLPGADLDFSLILFGDQNENLAYFIYALVQMGKAGIGKKINGRRGTYRLEHVILRDSVIYDSNEELLKLPGNIEYISPVELTAGGISCNRLKINIITPLRIKFKNRLSNELPFHVLVRAMLRRAFSLFESYGNAQPDFDYRELVRRATEVKTLRSELTWLDWRRYSNRQQRAMFMGGITGSIEYGGTLREFLPLIEFSRKVHIGKQTTFGLGQIDYEIVA